MDAVHLQSLITYTRVVLETNNINPHILDNIQTIDEYYNVIDVLWGWNSTQTYHLMDGYYRYPQRTSSIISWHTTIPQLTINNIPDHP
jgi:hypothetical protein